MLSKMLDNASSIAIGGHLRPDGDCVGSCMGLYQYVRENYKDKETDVYLEEIPEAYKFIEATGDIRHEAEPGKHYDLFISLDCGDKERLGFSAPLFDGADRTFCIDHHISNGGFAMENYIKPQASSTSELVYDLLDKEKISLRTAEALYLGIVHDTGAFRYSCASDTTFEVAAGLLRKGVDGSRIIEETFFEKTYAQNQVLGRALLESFLLLDGKCVVSSIHQRDMEFYHVDPSDLDGVVSQLRLTKGVEVAVFMYETEPNVYKVSLRSTDAVDVSRIAQYFGGGGHKKAAGFSMRGTPYDIMNNLTEHIAPLL